MLRKTLIFCLITFICFRLGAQTGDIQILVGELNKNENARSLVLVDAQKQIFIFVGYSEDISAPNKKYLMIGSFDAAKKQVLWYKTSEIAGMNHAEYWKVIKMSDQQHVVAIGNVTTADGKRRGLVTKYKINTGQTIWSNRLDIDLANYTHPISYNETFFYDAVETANSGVLIVGGVTESSGTKNRTMTCSVDESTGRFTSANALPVMKHDLDNSIACNHYATSVVRRFNDALSPIIYYLSGIFSDGITTGIYTANVLPLADFFTGEVTLNNLTLGTTYHRLNYNRQGTNYNNLFCKDARLIDEDLVINTIQQDANGTNTDAGMIVVGNHYNVSVNTSWSKKMLTIGLANSPISNQYDMGFYKPALFALSDRRVVSILSPLYPNGNRDILISEHPNFSTLTASNLVSNSGRLISNLYYQAISGLDVSSHKIFASGLAHKVSNKSFGLQPYSYLQSDALLISKPLAVFPCGEQKDLFSQDITLNTVTSATSSSHYYTAFSMIENSLIEKIGKAGYIQNQCNCDLEYIQIK
jgi:hypothetical protein